MQAGCFRFDLHEASGAWRHYLDIIQASNSPLRLLGGSIPPSPLVLASGPIAEPWI